MLRECRDTKVPPSTLPTDLVLTNSFQGFPFFFGSPSDVFQILLTSETAFSALPLSLISPGENAFLPVLAHLEVSLHSQSASVEFQF